VNHQPSQTTRKANDQTKVPLQNPARSGLSALLPAAGMEVCRLYAAVSFLYCIPESPPYPFAAFVCVLSAGTLVGRGLSFVSRRRITTAAVYGGICALCAFLIARPYSGYPFWLSVFVTAFFWFRGAWIGSRGISHAMTVTRYDIGIGVLLSVYFLRMGLGEPDPYALRVVGAYFLFSILALAASRSWETDENFIASRPAWSLLALFITVFFLAAAALVLLYPILISAAGEMYVFLQKASVPLVNILLAIIRFLFGFGRGRRLDPSSTPLPEATYYVPGEAESEPGILIKIAFGVFILVCAALALFLAFIFIRNLLRYLTVKTGTPGGPGLLSGLRMLCRFILKKLRTVFRITGKAAGLLLARRRPLAGAGQEAFRKLCAWGRVSGAPRKKCETPAEYACRLAVRFPSLEEALSHLARGVEHELYGRSILAADDIVRLKSALLSLSNPALIPGRFASRLGIRGRPFAG